MSDKRHYDTDKLHKDYKEVYNLMMKVTMYGVGGALVYFFIFIVYLGGFSHTKSEDYVSTFNERYPQDYKGLKLPEFGGPAAPEPKHHGEEAHAAPEAHAAAPAATDVTPSEAPAAAETTVSATEAVAPATEQTH